MFCVKCGAQNADDATFCASCGAAMETGAVTTPEHQVPAEPTPEMKMGWYKFLIYFALFAGAVLNLFMNAIPLLTGSVYGSDGEAELIYMFYDGLKGLDTIVGLGSLAMAALAIYTRFRLSGYYKDGPLLLNVLYAGNIVVNLAYLIGLSVILPSELMAQINTSSLVTGSIVGAIMIFYNTRYFKARKHLFVK